MKDYYASIKNHVVQSIQMWGKETVTIYSQGRKNSCLGFNPSSATYSVTLEKVTESLCTSVSSSLKDEAGNAIISNFVVRMKWLNTCNVFKTERSM